MSALTDHPVHVALRLLDRRVVDADGEPVGRVDDLAFDRAGDGGPRLVSILMGPEALGARLGGVLGGIVAGAGRLRPDGAGPPEVAIDDLDEVGPEVRLKAHRDELPFPRSEAWVREHVIGRIPGATRSSSSGKEPGGDGRATGRAERRAEGHASYASGSDDGRIRASDLLGTRIVDRDGRSLGRVRDLRLGVDGDGHRIEGLVTGRGVIAERLGYAYGDVAGPWLLGVVMRRAARRTRYLDWDAIDELRRGRITVRGDSRPYGSPEDRP